MCFHNLVFFLLIVNKYITIIGENSICELINTPKNKRCQKDVITININKTRV